MADMGNLEESVKSILSSERKETLRKLEHLALFRQEMGKFNAFLRDVPAVFKSHDVEPRPAWRRRLGDYDGGYTYSQENKHLFRPTTTESKEVEVVCLYPAGWPIEFWCEDAYDHAKKSSWALIDPVGNVWTPPSEADIRRAVDLAKKPRVTVDAVLSTAPRDPGESKSPWPWMGILWGHTFRPNELIVRITRGYDTADILDTATAALTRWAAGLIGGKPACSPSER